MSGNIYFSPFDFGSACSILTTGVWLTSCELPYFMLGRVLGL